MDKKKLRALMILNSDTRDSLAEYLGLTPTTLSYKMNESHGTCFNKAEIQEIAKKYSLSKNDIAEIFFTDVVSKKDTLNFTNRKDQL